MSWNKIEDTKPEEEVEVFYFFPFLGMYRGKYVPVQYPSEIFEEGEEPCYGDCFYGESGFLTDDVTHWQYSFGVEEFPELPEGYIKIGEGRFREYALESDTVRITKYEYESLKERVEYLEAGHLYGMCCPGDECPTHIYYNDEDDGYKCGACGTVYPTKEVEENPRRYRSKYEHKCTHCDDGYLSYREDGYPTNEYYACDKCDSIFNLAEVDEMESD
jgi:hypothetical protein